MDGSLDRGSIPRYSIKNGREFFPSVFFGIKGIERRDLGACTERTVRCTVRVEARPERRPSRRWDSPLLHEKRMVETFMFLPSFFRGLYIEESNGETSVLAPREQYGVLFGSKPGLKGGRAVGGIPRYHFSWSSGK